MQYSKINGFQHVGVAVKDHEASWRWYRKFFKMDVPFFNSVAEAPLMKVYTKGNTINKRAAMVMNLKGGCAFEVVSPVSFEARKPDFEVNLGDIGIFIACMKSSDIQKSKLIFEKENTWNSAIAKSPDNLNCFYVQDPNGLYFQVIEGGEWYSKMDFPTGGATSIVVGVKNIDASAYFYKDLLGFNQVVYDQSGVFNDFNSLPNGHGKFRRLKLTQTKPIEGGFSILGGTCSIELIQSIDDYEPKKIWKGRIWGDIGFVHLGMDVRGMKAIGEKLSTAGHPFTCDTESILSMGDSTKVHCTYIDDPDGILIEMIEVFKIPLVEKWRIYLDLMKRDPRRPLPNWLLKLMRFMRVKD